MKKFFFWAGWISMISGLSLCALVGYQLKDHSLDSAYFNIVINIVIQMVIIGGISLCTHGVLLGFEIKKIDRQTAYNNKIISRNKIVIVLSNVN